MNKAKRHKKIVTADIKIGEVFYYLPPDVDKVIRIIKGDGYILKCPCCIVPIGIILGAYPVRYIPSGITILYWAKKESLQCSG